MDQGIKLEVIRFDNLTTDKLESIHATCNRASEEALTALFNTFRDATHVLGDFGETIVSHAMWVTRWLQPGNVPQLRTAYLVIVTTDPNYQRHGFATVLMKQLAGENTDLELGGLCPAEPELYEKLGWVFWRGPLFIHAAERLISIPDEKVMILRLKKTPALDLNLPLSAEWRDGELW